MITTAIPCIGRRKGCNHRLFHSKKLPVCQIQIYGYNSFFIDRILINRREQLSNIGLRQQPGKLYVKLNVDREVKARTVALKGNAPDGMRHSNCKSSFNLGSLLLKLKWRAYK
jgi:hypothetical protein